MISNRRNVCRARRWSTGVGLAGGAVVAAAMVGIGAAHADDSTEQINGWTVTPTSDNVGVLTNNATLSDPSNALGLGTSPIVGEWISGPTQFSSIGSDQQFTTPYAVGTSANLYIQDNWLPGFEEATVQAHNSEVVAFLVPALSGNQVVDLYNFGTPDAPPLFNPDAIGPIEVGGVELASPQAGALLNDLSDAIFTGNAADWTNAMTLFDDYLGIDPSGAADALDLGSWLP